MSESVPRVPSAEAEAASALLFRTLADHRAAIAALRRRPAPRLRISLDGDPVQERCQATLVRLLSITEAFAADLLSREIDQAVTGAQNPAAMKLAEEAVIRGTSSWQDQQKSYKDWLDVQTDWKPVERLAEARNAIAHGLGRLTKRQLRTEQRTKSRIKAAGILITNNRIILSDESLAAAAVACRDFIENLDLAVQDKVVCGPSDASAASPRRQERRSTR